MSDVRRCAACRKEKPVSEMKVCMHAEMHNYVCDSKCMHDFYNPPKAEKTGHAAIIAELQSMLSAAEAERDQLRAELAAIRGQEPVAWATPDAIGGVRWSPGALQQLSDGAPLYALPPKQPDAVSVPMELKALKRDAERYRWLCEKFGITKLPCAIERILEGDVYVADGKNGIDAAIDAARQEGALSTRQAEEGQPCDK